jgi:hypothetical protein
MKRVFVLQPLPHPSRRLAAQHCMEAPDGQVVTFSEPAKTREQEKLYHAQIGDIARSVPLGDRLWPEEDAKRILVSAFRIDTKDDDNLREHWQKFGAWQLVPGLRGEFVVTGIPTRQFPKPLASAFIEWLYAFGAERDVQWSDPALRRPVAEVA